MILGQNEMNRNFLKKKETIPGFHIIVMIAYQHMETVQQAYPVYDN